MMFEILQRIAVSGRKQEDPRKDLFESLVFA